MRSMRSVPTSAPCTCLRTGHWPAPTESSAAAAGLAFVSDGLMDEPEQTKEGLRAAYRRLLGLDFDLLLLAHGDPVIDGGKAALRTFVDG